MSSNYHCIYDLLNKLIFYKHLSVVYLVSRQFMSCCYLINMLKDYKLDTVTGCCSLEFLNFQVYNRKL